MHIVAFLLLFALFGSSSNPSERDMSEYGMLLENTRYFRTKFDVHEVPRLESVEMLGAVFSFLSCSFNPTLYVRRNTYFVHLCRENYSMNTSFWSEFTPHHCLDLIYPDTEVLFDFVCRFSWKCGKTNRIGVRSFIVPILCIFTRLYLQMLENFRLRLGSLSSPYQKI